MKKSLVALAVAGVFAAPAAFADVTISGAVNFGLSYDRAGDSTGTNNTGFSKFSLASNYSNFNIASVDDIGGGNSVVLNIQTALGLANADTNGNSAFGNRNSYLGVKGGWGGLYWGTNENIYEQYMYESDPLDGAAGMGGNLQMLGTPGGAVFEVGQGTGNVDFYRRTNHTVWYASPNWGGFSFAIDYTLNAGKTSASSDSPQVISVGAQFKPDGGPFFVNAAIERHNDMYGVNAFGAGAAAGQGSRDTGIQIGGGFMIGDVSLVARWETLRYVVDGQGTGELREAGRDAIWGGVKIGLANGYFGAEIGIADDGDCEVVRGSCNAEDTGAVMFGAGYFHNLSKQSQLQLIGSYTNNDDNANYLHAGGSNPNGGFGVSRFGIYAGIKHVF